jgi:membrane protein implicated in regulation of membrane protease activity
MMTVFVLAVLWLIVVVPMVVRRNDERRRERSVDGFGRAMRALGRRVVAPSTPAATEVFVPAERRAAVATPARRPVPAAREALMFPVDRSELSAARTQMMTRRRRSLGLLGLGAAVFLPWAVLAGGLMWLAAAPFAVGLLGYVYFLRTQAQRDRERREQRQRRAVDRRMRGYDATSPAGRFDDAASTAVRIDDDDPELDNMETIDLTGLYNEDHPPVGAARRAS